MRLTFYQAVVFDETGNIHQYNDLVTRQLGFSLGQPRQRARYQLPPVRLNFLRAVLYTTKLTIRRIER